MRKLSVVYSSVLILSSLSVQPAAQETPRIVDPGSIEELVTPPPQPRSELPEIDVPPDSEQLPPADATERFFELKDVVINGNTVFDDDELSSIWEPYLGTEIALALLWEFRAQITVRYRNAGYILSQAVVPAQEIDDGVVELAIVEGFVDNVIIEGDIGGAFAQITEKTVRIKEAVPLHADVLERYMLLINDLAGISAQSVLRPSPLQSGASELVIFLEEQKYAGSVGIDNYGSRFLGREQANVALVANNLYGAFDSTELRGLVSVDVEELQFVALTHYVPIATEGTMLSLSGSFAHTKPGSSLSSQDIEGTSFGFSAIATHPLIRTRTENFSLAGGFRSRDSENTTSGIDLSKDRIRALTFSGTYDFVDAYRGINLIGIEVAQGLDILSARGKGDNDPPPSRANGRSDFTKIEAGVTREQYLARGWSVKGSLKGQYALSQLLSSEQFGFGGEEFGRGYDGFEISGDHGIAAKLQLQYGGASSWKYLDSYQAYTFFDVGRTWLIDDDAADDDETATSTGAGVLFNLEYNAAAKLEIGVPLNRDPEDSKQGQGEPRIGFRLTKRF